jgi:subtilisin family serine protease
LLDAGIYDHPDFGDRIRYDLARNTLDSRDGDGANPTDLDDVTDLHGHGTAVTGVIAGSVTGTCPEVDIIPIRIANAEAMADFSDMAEGIDYLIGLKNSGTLSRSAHLIVNLSYNTLDPLSDSDPDAEAAFRDMIETAADSQILFVASAGNNGTDIDRSFVYPTSLFNENLLSVAATTSNSTLASFSNYGLHTVEVATPGQSILTTTKTGGRSIWNGTSFAAPFSAGIAALLWSMHDELDDVQIRNVLINATDAQRFLSTTAGSSSSLTVIAGDCMDPSELTSDAFITSAAGSTPITGNETVDFVPDDAGTGDTGGVAGGGGGCSLTSLPAGALLLLPLSLLYGLRLRR